MCPNKVLEIRKGISKKFLTNRLKKKITREQIHQKTGLSKSTIINIESGRKSWFINSELLYVNACETLEPLEKAKAPADKKAAR